MHNNCGDEHNNEVATNYNSAQYFIGSQSYPIEITKNWILIQQSMIKPHQTKNSLPILQSEIKKFHNNVILFTDMKLQKN